MPILGRVEIVAAGALRGWAWDNEHPTRRLTLAVTMDGAVVGETVADIPRPDLLQAGIGDGAHSFVFALPRHCLDGARHAFSIAPVGQQAAVAQATLATTVFQHRLDGKLERIFKTWVAGWVRDHAEPQRHVRVEFLFGDQPFATVTANRFRDDLLKAGFGTGTHSFVLPVTRLPPHRRAGEDLVARVAVPGGYWELGRLAVPDAAGVAALLGEIRNPALAAAKKAERERNFAASAAILDEIMPGAEDDLDVLLQRARAAMGLADHPTAERCARRAHDLNPSEPRVVLTLCRLALEQGRHEEAVELWTRVTPGDRAYRERLLKRGRSLVLLGRPLEALAEARAALALDAADRDAHLAAADAAEAAGALRHALRFVTAFAALVPEDHAAQDRLRDLQHRLELERQEATGLGSPLANPWLRHWLVPVEGEVHDGTLALAPGMVLTAPSGTAVRYAAAAPSQRRPGERSGYGLWLESEGGVLELAFAMAPAAREALVQGLDMAIEVAALDAGMQVELALLRDGGERRSLLLAPLPPRPLLLTFPLRLAASEALALAAGALTLRVTLAGAEARAGRVLVQPPRPLRLHQPPAQPREQPEALAAMAALAPLLRGGAEATP
jgi:tetratricopeptide (TPR) repeat protein